MSMATIKEFFPIVLAFCLSCINYIHTSVVIPKGARIKIESGYGETMFFYDVRAQYIQNVNVELITTNYDTTTRVAIDSIADGEKTVFLINGCYEPIPYSTAGAERFTLYIVLDSFDLNDTIYFSSDRSIIGFYYEKVYSGLLQTGLARKLSGYCVVHTMNNDTLCAYIEIEGETVGSYSNMLNNVCDHAALSRICGRIEFKAIKKRLKGKSEVILRLGP